MDGDKFGLLKELEANDQEYITAIAKKKEFNRIIDESNMKLEILNREKRILVERLEALKSQLNAATNGINPIAAAELPIVAGKLKEDNTELIAVKKQNDIIAKNCEIMKFQVGELQSFVDANSGSNTSKEERIRQQENLKQTLQHDIYNIFGQLGSAANIGHVDQAYLSINQELLEELRNYFRLDQELRSKTMSFIKKSISAEEKELLKNAALAAKLPFDVNNESLKYHLSIQQRIQAVEIKITSNHVPVPGKPAPSIKKVPNPIKK